MAPSYVGLTISYKNGTYVISAQEAQLTSADTLQDFVDYWLANGSPTGEEIGYSLTEGGTAIDLSTIYSSAFPSVYDDNYLYALYPTVYPETIAGQISRLQDAKTCIKAAIEEKGVTIGSDVTLDGYADCIGEISSGGGGQYVELLVVGGGGGGPVIGGGGGGGGVIYCTNYNLLESEYPIVIGLGGNNNTSYGCSGCNGGDSCFGTLVACGGGGGGNGTYCSCPGCPGGSGGGAGMGGGGRGVKDGGGPIKELGNIIAQGGQGGVTAMFCGSCALPGAGGGGAGGDGGSVMSGCECGGRGGPGVRLGISGNNVYYGAGGGGGGYNDKGYPGGTCGGSGGTGGGGRGGYCICSRCSNCQKAGCNGTCYGAGGGGGGASDSYPGGCGYQGIVIVRYHTDGSDGITSATGGCKYTCGDYTIHCFTSNGTFCITG